MITIIPGFAGNDEYKLDIKYPYYGIVLNAEEAELVKNCHLVIYNIDGREMIDVKSDGEVTGEKMAFIVFVPKK